MAEEQGRGTGAGRPALILSIVSYRECIQIPAKAGAI